MLQSEATLTAGHAAWQSFLHLIIHSRRWCHVMTRLLGHAVAEVTWCVLNQNFPPNVHRHRLKCSYACVSMFHNNTVTH